MGVSSCLASARLVWVCRLASARLVWVCRPAKLLWVE